MPSQTIQWFPGHMAKTRRMMAEYLPQVDAVIEVRDARIPESSRNPEIDRICRGKPRLTLLTKSSLADPNATARWKQFYAAEGRPCLFVDCVTGEGIRQLPEAIRRLLADKLRRYEEKGMSGRALRVMVVGIPNSGKSSLINRLAGRKRAKVEDRPGVTTDRQWVRGPGGLELLDMPGVLWPKFVDRIVGENLALTGAIRDAILDTEELAVILVGRLRAIYPALLDARYKLGGEESWRELDNFELFERIGRKRGFLIAGGEVSAERTAVMLLDEFRGAAIGRISLELPEVTACVKHPAADD